LGDKDAYSIQIFYVGSRMFRCEICSNTVCTTHIRDPNIPTSEISLRFPQPEPQYRLQGLILLTAHASIGVGVHDKWLQVSGIPQPKAEPSQLVLRMQDELQLAIVQERIVEASDIGHFSLNGTFLGLHVYRLDLLLGYSPVKQAVHATCSCRPFGSDLIIQAERDLVIESLFEA
jgi:hypothetical protein